MLVFIFLFLQDQIKYNKILKLKMKTFIVEKKGFIFIN